MYSLPSNRSEPSRNTPHDEVSRLLNEAIGLNQDPAVAKKLQQCKFMIESLDEYLETTCSTPSAFRKKILDDTFSEPWAEVHRQGHTSNLLHTACISGHYEGQFLKMIAEMSKAERILELGMFTGYSAVTFCESHYSTEVVALELVPYLESFVRSRTVKHPAIDEKLRIIVGRALSGLETLKAEGKVFDLIFIDADKQNYPTYYKYIMDNGLLSPGGIILVDNALWFSEVYPKPSTPLGKLVAELNEFVRTDDRVTQVMVPVCDGILMVQSKLK